MIQPMVREDPGSPDMGLFARLCVRAAAVEREDPTELRLKT